MGAVTTGGDALDVLNSVIIGGVAGAAIGAIDPTPGLGTLVLIGAGSGFVGDLTGQIFGGASRGCIAINAGQLAGSTLAGAVSPLMAGSGGAYPLGELINNQLAAIGASGLLPRVGQEIGKGKEIGKVGTGCGCQ